MKWLVIALLFINFCYYFPTLAKRMLCTGIIQHDLHFKPSYEPFQQRM
jgi:hypothetical protein